MAIEVVPEAQTPQPSPAGGRRTSIVVAREKYHTWLEKEQQMMRQIFHPNNSTFLQTWDNIVAVALVFTATITPVEVSFLNTQIDFLFVLNRIMDIIFIIDIWVQTRLAFFDNVTRNWITNRKRILQRYAEGWMLIDVVSTIPYDLIDIIVPQNGAESEGGGSNLKVLRVLKILKLVKLLRIIKGAKIFGRIQLKLEISNSNASLVQYAVGMGLLVHWIACMWGLGPAFNDHSWAHDPERAGCIDKDGNILCAGFVDKKPAEMYLLCLHFAVQAIVMGEAEDHMPETNNDRLLGVVCMLLGGTCYAYVIGSICTVLSMRDPATRDFKDACDLVSKFASENKLPKELEIKLKEYFYNSEQLFRNRKYGTVFDDMAPSLKIKVANEMHGGWLKEVPFFTATNKDEREAFVAAVSMLLRPCTFPPQEEVYCIGHSAKFMMIITRGMATEAGSKGTRILKLGNHFGEEMILRYSTRLATIRAISYLNCNELRREELLQFLTDTASAFPETNRLVRRARIRLALRRCVTKINAMFALALRKRSWSAEEMKLYKDDLLVKINERKEKARIQEKAAASMGPPLPKQKQGGSRQNAGGGFSLITGASLGGPETFEEHKDEFAALTTPEFAAQIHARMHKLAQEALEKLKKSTGLDHITHPDDPMWMRKRNSKIADDGADIDEKLATLDRRMQENEQMLRNQNKMIRKMYEALGGDDATEKADN